MFLRAAAPGLGSAKGAEPILGYSRSSLRDSEIISGVPDGIIRDYLFITQHLFGNTHRTHPRLFSVVPKGT